MIVDTMVTALLLLPLVWGETVEEVKEEVLNCTGYVLIPDLRNQKHPFYENITDLELKTAKDDVVTVEGDCCFELFSGDSGSGTAQLLQAPGNFRLELELVNSVYRVDCARRGMHPVLKFFLISLAIVVLLGLIYHFGKEALFRKRV